MTTRYDVVIVGGGHNGLTAAAYLAQAGKSVIVLERLSAVGGAAVSAQTFDGVEARLSRYSYLVSLLPARVIRDLGLKIQLKRRQYSSYTPRPGTSAGVLVDSSLRGLGPSADAWRSFYSGTATLARAMFPTVTEPLLTRSEARAALGDDKLWSSMIERPIGSLIESTFDDDLVRGVALTDALIGTFAPNVDETLAGNRCFLYHVIGNGTGDWDVPIGGMGAVTSELLDATRRAGATIVTEAEVVGITPDGEVTYLVDDRSVSVVGGWVLANVAPYVLEGLLRPAGTSVGSGSAGAGFAAAGSSAGADSAAAGSVDRGSAGGSSAAASSVARGSAGASSAGRVGRDEGAAVSRPGPPKPEGSQVKVNLLLSRLPRLRDASVDPDAAFGGTFHVNELWSQLDAAYTTASAGGVPSPLPCEIYCHSLTDPSILAPELRASGAHTLTVFGLHTPDRLVTPSTNESVRASLQDAVLASLDSVLAEPIEGLLLRDASGDPTIETKTTLDLEHALGMPGGNIFHGPLSWPFLEDDAPLSTAAERWGVATSYPRILLCGSGAQRGGAVSGLGGHNAAMAVLEG